MTASRVGAALALAGIVLLAVGMWLDPARAARAWRWSWLWAWTTALGSLSLLYVAHLAPIGWLAGLRRPLAALATAAAPIGIGVVVVLVGPDLGDERVLPRLDPASMALRDALAMVAVVGLALWSRTAAGSDTGEAVARVRAASAPGLCLLAGIWTLGAVDWAMAIEAPWMSLVYGVRWATLGMLSAMAWIALIAILCEARRALPPLPTDVIGALGRLLLGFVLLWAYTGYAELLIGWLAELPRDAGHLGARLRGGGGALLTVLALGGLVGPVLVLLSRSAKRSRRLLGALCAWVLAMTAVDALSLVVGGAGVAALQVGDLGGLLLWVGVLLLAADGGPDPDDPLLAATLSYRRGAP